MSETRGNHWDLSGSGAAPLEPDDPSRLGPFPLIGRLGTGGMGRVYLGVGPDAFVAVKQIRPLLGEDEAFLLHFGRELDNLTRLPDGFRAALLASDRTARPPWFATDYIPGLTLADVVARHGGPLPSAALRALLRDLLTGLATVHERKIVHRDIKPSNIMVTADEFLLIDFGIARAADQSGVTRTGMIVGTPPYMAPEQAAGVARLTGAVDIFALGSLLGYAASGQPPFGDSSGPEQLYRIVHHEPDLTGLREADPDLAELVAECLAKDPEARPTARQLLDRLASDTTRVEGEGVAAAFAWPPQIAEPLAERAAFTRNVPDAGKLLAAAEKAAAPGAAAELPAVSSDAPSGSKRKRRPRALTVGVPVVVVAAAATATLTLTPFNRPFDDQAAPPTHTPSASAPHSASPSPSPSKSPSRKPKPEHSATAHSTDAGSPPPAKHGGSSTHHGSSSGDGGKSSSSGSRGGSLNPPSGGAMPAGAHRLKVASGQCLHTTSNQFAPAMAACGSDASFGWTFKRASNGTFLIVSSANHQCLEITTGVASSYDCSQKPLWRYGPAPSSGFTLQDASTGACLSITESNGTVSGTTCNPGNRAEIWRDGGAV